jgi:hypothetical protein
MSSTHHAKKGKGVDYRVVYDTTSSYLKHTLQATKAAQQQIAT